MPYEDRKQLMQKIESSRCGRTIISLCNFDRQSNPEIPGLSTSFQSDLKECLYRILKESPTEKGIDLFLYTRGGDTNSVWPIVSLLREFDPDFQVIIPFRAHSAGTMIALSAAKIHMTRLGELSPIDPTTGNQFNPQDPNKKNSRLGIAVEDVKAYQDFLTETLDLTEKEINERREILILSLKNLSEKIHPLALGNVHRVSQLVSRLAKKLLELHLPEDNDINSIVENLTVKSFSHLHMIGRDEALSILSNKRIEFTNEDFEQSLDSLLMQYEDDFQLRRPFFLNNLLGQDVAQKEFRFIGAVVESRHWSYLFETKGIARQFTVIPQGINVQVPPGQNMPLIPGLPRDIKIDINEQRWHHNTEPEGITT